MTYFDPSQDIDWQKLWDELEWDNQDYREKTTGLRLKQRARQYAALPQEEDDDIANKYHVLIFDLGKEQYGIDVTLVQKVLTIDKISPVPGTPDFYAGVVNVRGQIITVLDLQVFFKMNMDTEREPRELIVVQANRLEIGILAHHIHDVITVPSADTESIDDVRYARGVTANGLVILDIARLFEDNRLVIGGSEEA